MNRSIAIIVTAFIVSVITATRSDSVEPTTDTLPSLGEVKAAGRLRSSLKKNSVPDRSQSPKANVVGFRRDLKPILNRTCVNCHGAETQEGEFRVDTLDPDLIHGADVDWWVEVLDVLSNGEMPPEDEDAVDLTDQERSQLIQWLSSEIQIASSVRRSEQGYSSFRRMTRYEYNYALQDLLGLPYEFAEDLPPETASEDGFTNSSEVLQMSAMQFAYYRDLGRKALVKATVRGSRPDPLYYCITMEEAASMMKPGLADEIAKRKERFRDDPDRLRRELQALFDKHRVNEKATHYANLNDGTKVKASWRYNGARFAWTPTNTRPKTPDVSPYVAILPANQRLIVELGNHVPDTGTMRVRIRASRAGVPDEHRPSLRLEFGWQASNNSSATERAGNGELVIDAEPGTPRFYQWDIPLSEIKVRNPMRKTAKMGNTPNPSEYLLIRNTSLSRGDVQIDYVDIAMPVYEQWPPESHNRIFINHHSGGGEDENADAREVLAEFLPRAWRREVTTAEIDQKLKLFHQLRGECDDFQETMIEVLATALASPKFLYLTRSQPTDRNSQPTKLDDFELATRLSFFLWSSCPDEQLFRLASQGQLSDPAVLAEQTRRMLDDAKSNRFSEQFVRGWLGMQLLDFLKVDEKVYPAFDTPLKEAMQKEPVMFFREVLRNDHSVIDFLHADYAMVNERLARHYGIPNVGGNHFRRVSLSSDNRRGGVLTQAGLLAMNSDGKDSHPLKRGIWMLDRLLNDPPPPPPPAVPEIDLADPEIAKLTLKQRIENHRDDPACLSCHAKIDPWGISLENFDAVGRWRDSIDGVPVDASSRLFNRQKLEGVDGLKRFLLANRQDQFVRALTHKMTTYALGRPLAFGDRSQVDNIAAELRMQGDGLATLVQLIVASDLFLTK